jgi:uncharacterized phage-associated protein
MISGMRISFRFDPDKAIQTIAYILSAVGGQIEKVKLTKLLYLADRWSFIERGVSITGDRLVAMPYGPVPSGCLDLLNGVALINRDRVFKFIHVEDTQVSARQDPGQSLLTDADRQVLDRIVRDYGATRTWKLVHETHALPEYKATYIEGSSTPIPFEAIASASADERRFRMHRPVVGPDTAAAMPCPFNPGADATL